MNELPPDEQDGDEELHGVIGEEIGHVPRLERRVSIEDGDQDHPHECEIRTIRLEATDVGELAAVEALGFTGAIVADKGDGDGDVVDQTCIVLVGYCPHSGGMSDTDLQR